MKNGSVVVVCPYPNPHLLEVIHRSCRHLGLDCSVFTFGALPQQRLELGWGDQYEAHRLDRSPTAWLRLVRELFRSEFVIQLGLATPRLRMLLCHGIARLTKQRIWIASEGFRSKPSPAVRLLARIYNSSNVTLLAIGTGSANDFRSAGMHKPYIYKFGFAEESLGQGRYIKRRRKEGRLRILSVGQLSDRKNHAALIRASSDERLRNQFEIRVCGAGPLQDQLTSAAKSAGVPLVLLGNCEPDILANEYANADIFAMPSLYDGWGVALNHAVLAGLPCLVSSNVRAGEDNLVENGINGYIFEDEPDLRIHLTKLVEDPELRYAMGQESKLIGQLWSVDSLAARLAQVIEAESDDFSLGPLSRVSV